MPAAVSSAIIAIYSYVAVELNDGVPGAVVSGSEPEFEATDVVAESIESFLGALVEGLDGDGDPRFAFLR